MVSAGLIPALVPAVRSALLLNSPSGVVAPGVGREETAVPRDVLHRGTLASQRNPLNVTTNHPASKRPAPTRLSGSKTCHTRRVQASKRSSENSCAARKNLKRTRCTCTAYNWGESSVLSGSNVVALRTCFMSDQDEAGRWALEMRRSSMCSSSSP